MTQEAGKLPAGTNGRALDHKSFPQVLDLFRRTRELERLDRDPDTDRLSLLEWREDVIQGVLSRSSCS